MVVTYRGWEEQSHTEGGKKVTYRGWEESYIHRVGR